MRNIAFYFRNKFVIVSLLFIIITINTQVSKAINLTNITEWWMNTTILFLFIMLIIFCSSSRPRIRFYILAFPLSWIAHSLLTIPAALILGILKYDPNHIRTAGEHRAVFILASIPIIIYFLVKSKLSEKEPG